MNPNIKDDMNIKTAIEEIGKENCTGCYGCYNFCPNKAIKMDYDLEGFLFPIIKAENCNNCGICLKICPVYNMNHKDSNFEEPIIYAGWSKNPEIRYQSSSGGIFYEIAQNILKKNGVVYGVGWGPNFTVKHQRITSEKNLPLIMGSKYLQSNVSMNYKHVIKDLSDNKFVLFSGTPCQIAFLKNYSNSPKLILLELICHGVPSKLIFDGFIEYKFKNYQIKKIDFRNKRYSWRDYAINFIFKNKNEYIKHHSIDDFFYGYLKNYFLNNACYNCIFARLPRQADITLGDFWTHDEKYNQKLGVSLVMLNNEKAHHIIKELSNITLIKEYISYAIKGNPRIISGKIIKPKIRHIIIHDLRENGFELILKKYYLKSLRRRKILFYTNYYILGNIPNPIKNKIIQFLNLMKNKLKQILDLF